MTALSGLSCNDLKFYWKIEPIRKEEEKLRVQIKSEEAALRRIVLQREATSRKELAGEREGAVEDADQQTVDPNCPGEDDFKSPVKQDDGRQESVLRLRCERRRKKLAHLHEEKLEILWNFVKEWPQLELDRLAFEPSLKNVKAVCRLALWYVVSPLDLLTEKAKWALIEELMEKFHKPTMCENKEKSTTEFTAEEELHLQDIEYCAPGGEEENAASERERADATEFNVNFRDLSSPVVIAEDSNDAACERAFFDEDSSEDATSSDLKTNNDDVSDKNGTVAIMGEAEEKPFDLKTNNHGISEEDGTVAVMGEAEEKLAVASPGWTERYLDQVRNLECPWNAEDDVREDWEIARTLQLELERESEGGQDEGRYLDNRPVLDLESEVETQQEMNEDDEVKVFNFTLFEEASIPVCSDKLQSSKTTTSVTTTKSRDVVLVTKPPLPSTHLQAKSRGSKSNRFSKKRVDKPKFDLQEFLSEFDKINITEPKKQALKPTKETERLSMSPWNQFEQNVHETDSPKHIVDYLTAPMVNEVENQIGVPANISFVAESCVEGGNAQSMPDYSCDTIVPTLNLNGLENCSSDEESQDDAHDVGDTYSGTIILQDEHERLHESAIASCKRVSQKNVTAENLAMLPTSDDCPKDAASNRCDDLKFAYPEEKSPPKGTAARIIHEPIQTGQKSTQETAKPANNAFDFTFQGAMAGKYRPLPTPRPDDVFPRGAFVSGHPSVFATPTDPSFNWPPLPQFPSNRLFPTRCAEATPYHFPPYIGCGNRARQFNQHQRETMARPNFDLGQGLTRAPMDPWRYQFPPPSMFDHQMDPKEVATNHIKWMLNVGGNPKAHLPPGPVQAAFRPTITGQPRRHEMQAKTDCAILANPIRMAGTGVAIGQQHRYNNAAALPRRDIGPIGFVGQQRICLVRPTYSRRAEGRDHPTFVEPVNTSSRETGPDKQVAVLENSLPRGSHDAANVKANSRDTKPLAKEVELSESNFFPSSCVFDTGLGI